MDRIETDAYYVSSLCGPFASEAEAQEWAVSKCGVASVVISGMSLLVAALDAAGQVTLPI